MGQNPLSNLSPKDFDSERMGGINGWIKTLFIVSVFLSFTQIATIFKDYMKQKRDTSILQFIDRSTIATESINSSLLTISRQYNDNSSEKQVQIVAKLAYENYKDKLILFTNDVISKNNISENWQMISEKVDEHIKLKFEEVVLASFMDFKNKSGKYLAVYLKPESLLKDLKCCVKLLIQNRSNPTVVEETLSRKISTIRMEYYKHISTEL